MRLIQYSAGWLSLDSAPLEEDVTLLVNDGASEPATGCLEHAAAIPG
jgi:hypothetical protein